MRVCYDSFIQGCSLIETHVRGRGILDFLDGKIVSTKVVIWMEVAASQWLRKCLLKKPMCLRLRSRLLKTRLSLRTHIHNGDDSGDHDKGETEKSVISGNKSRGGSIEENLLAKPKLNMDSSSNSGSADLNVVLDRKKSVMESEIDCNDKVQLEVGGSTAL
ncbi:dentin sialophosphoprotein [Pyrus ussuriensis x Pyrus communis]|uniref:Dentin sialophosphoprotein n=1 Tax=Pyrus ussuriensis x Pyrus communis TaxID=2448454 RepID=A0A5N5EV37_9ROSA|nr:dentin sialophosphoprotein [Pyrus ussuriensis x Pyrus communis]